MWNHTTWYDIMICEDVTCVQSSNVDRSQWPKWGHQESASLRHGNIGAFRWLTKLYEDHLLQRYISVKCSRKPDQFLPRCIECRRCLAIRILSVCLSVCLFLWQTRALRQNGRKICPGFNTIYKRSFSLSFLRKVWLVGGWPLSSST